MYFTEVSLRLSLVQKVLKQRRRNWGHLPQDFAAVTKNACFVSGVPL